jgi:hypothetical protein
MKLRMFEALVVPVFLFVFLRLWFPSLSHVKGSPLDFSLHGSRMENSSVGNLLHNGNPSKLLLSVPFYVLLGCHLAECNLGWKSGRGEKPTKHSDDYWFMYNALRHPMRTLNASKAMIATMKGATNDSTTVECSVHG